MTGRAVIGPLLGVVLLALTACAADERREQVSGDAVSAFSDPFTVAGLPVTTGPNGLRADTTGPDLDIRGGTGDQIDALMAAALADLDTYWKQAFEPAFGQGFKTGLRFVSWDAQTSETLSESFCGQSTFRQVNAAFCPDRIEIGWDRGVLMPALLEEFGPMAPVTVIAHEYGHYIQMIGGFDKSASPIVSEQQADCLSGTFIRWLAEGHGEYLEINTGDGLNSAVAALISARDGRRGQSDHGTAFERADAFKTGFSSGAAVCGAIGQLYVDEKRDLMPPRFDNTGSIDATPFSEAGLSSVVASVEDFYGLSDSVRPVVDRTALGISCADVDVAVVAQAPVAFCPTTNTVSMDPDELALIATNGTNGPAGLPSFIGGDFSAYSLVASRYSVAAQSARGQAIDQPVTAARAACDTGRWARSTAASGTFTLRGGDLDELVSGLLVSGAVASDVAGRSLPSGFARIDAFTAGYFDTENGCSRYDP